MDSATVLVEHVSPAIAGGRSDRNWLLDLFGQFPIPRQQHWLSLGAGSIGQALWALEQGLFAGFDGFDSAAEAVAAAQQQAEKKGVGAVHLEVADPETLTLPAGRYDGALAAMVLFRVPSLDRLLAEIASSLRPGAYFLVNEYVGPSQFQLTDHQLQIVDELLALLPDRLRTDYVLGQIKEVYTRRPRAFWDAEAPREGISAEEIAPGLARHFEVVERRDYGGTILNPLLENIIGNFSAEREDDLTILRLLMYIEKVLLRESCLSSDFAVFVARKR